MSGVEFSVRLTKRQAEAVLRCEGLSEGFGVLRSAALLEAERRLLDAIQDAYNAAVLP